MASNALMKPMQPSSDLAKIVGSEPIARSQVVSKMWDYIKANNLQNPANKREIVAANKMDLAIDDVALLKLREELGGKTVHAISGVSRQGVEPLLELIWRELLELKAESVAAVV